MLVTTTNIEETLVRDVAQAIVLAIVRAEKWESQGDLRAAQDEISACIESLQEEKARITRKRHVPEAMRQTWNGERFNQL